MEEKEKQEKRIEIVKKQREAWASIHRTTTENPDSITIGSATKGAQLKIYGDFSKPEEFKKKIDAAKEVRDYAQANIEINI